MAKQPRFLPPFEGPFLGLNTTTDPGRLGPSYARVCRNVLLADGRISSRPPWPAIYARPDFGLEGQPGRYQYNAIVRGMYHWFKSTSAIPLIIAKIGRNYYGLYTPSEPLTEPREIMVDLTSAMELDSDFAPCFVETGGYLYILDGNRSAIRTNGTVGGTMWSGIRAPGAGDMNLDPNVAVPAGTGINARVDYAITWYDRFREVESNPVYSGEYVHNNAQGFGYTVPMLTERPPNYGITGIRVYRKNRSLNQVGYRLIAEHNCSSLPVARIDTTDGSSSSAEDTALADVSDRVNGPWAPSRNYVVEAPLRGTLYKDRLFYSRRYGNDLHYCAIDHPEYTHPDDVEDAGGQIKGLMAMGDQLYVGKRRGFKVLSGEIITHTNFTVATGATPLDSSHRWYDAQGVDVGPTGDSGNSMFLAGEPTRIYIVSDVGLVEFDGVTTRVVSDAIRPTWQAFVRPRSFLRMEATDLSLISFSFAHDAENGVLYIANDEMCKPLHSDRTDAIDCLAYHYKLNRGDGVGAWSQIDDGDVKLTCSGYPDGQPFVVTCVANSIGYARSYPDVLRGPAPIIVGTNLGAVLLSSQDDPAAVMPVWRYVTGDMPLVKGYGGHVYFVRVFVNRAVRVAGMTGPHLIEVQVTLDRHPVHEVPERSVMRSVRDAETIGRGGDVLRELGPFEKTIDIDPSLMDDRLIPIRAHGRTVSIDFRKGGAWTDGWSPHVGVLGWSMDVEPTGQR